MGQASQGDKVVWSDGGCFRIVSADGVLWVEEILHSEQFGDTPKRWRIRFATITDALRMIAGRLRQGHTLLYHTRVTTR